MQTPVGTIFADQHEEWQTSNRREFTLNNASVLELDHPFTLEVEAA